MRESIKDHSRLLHIEEAHKFPWKMMEGMRHVLVHDYYCIRPSKLWATVKNDIPLLYPEIKKLITDTETKDL